MLKKGVFAMAVVLLIATVSVGPAVPETDAQGIKLVNVWQPCDDGHPCCYRVCEISTYNDCGPFIQCQC